MRTKENLPFRKLILLICWNRYRFHSRPPANPRADSGCGLKKPFGIVGKLLPDLLLSLPTSLKPFSSVVWIEAQKIAELHVHAIWVTKLLCIRPAVVNRESIQNLAQLYDRGL